MTGTLSAVASPPGFVSVLGGGIAPPCSIWARSRASKNAKLDLHGSLLHLCLEASRDCASNERPRGREEAKKSDDICQNTGGDQQCTGYKDNDAVHKFFAWKIARIEAFVQPAPRIEAFSTSEVASCNARNDDKPNRGPKPDELVDLNEQAELDRRGEKEEKHQTSNHIHYREKGSDVRVGATEKNSLSVTGGT